GSMWTRIGSASLTSQGGATSQTPARGEFNAYIDLLLSYASWIGMGVCVFGVLFLGIVLATNARRGDGAGLVNTATLLASGAALIGGATSLIGFLVPARAMNLTGSVGFIQDQTFYLTLAVAALSVMIAGARWPGPSVLNQPGSCSRACSPWPWSPPPESRSSTSWWQAPTPWPCRSSTPPSGRTSRPTCSNCWPWTTPPAPARPIRCG
ncbi:hypothetical protein, partial [Kocuria sp. CNJ-770]|uniref:hypothetical protein n=1 Tax=Kocuria sp. CNJ-770 TaxID=1904964 RepID=UPI001C9E36B8